MKVCDSVVSTDGFLKVTLDAFNPDRGNGNIKIEELSDKVGRFFVNVNFRSGERDTVDYRPGDVSRSGALFGISTTTRNDAISSIVLTPA